MFLNPLLARSLNFWGGAVNWLLGGEKNCIVHSLFCICITIITIISIVISISTQFVVLLNCLYLIPLVFPFEHFLLPIPLVGKRRDE